MVAAGSGAAGGRAERRCSSCSTTSGTRSSVATAPTSTTPVIDALAGRRRAPRQLPHHRAVLTDAGVPAHRAQPPLERHGPRRRPRRSASPGYNGIDPPRERLPLRDPRARTATCRSRSASGTSRPRTRRTSRRRASRGRAAAASGTGTASTAARPTSSCRTCSATTPPSRRRDRPPTATTSPRTSPTRRSRCSARSAASSRTRPSTCTSPPARATRRTTRPSEWRERYRGRFDAGWDAWREATFARQRRWACSPSTTVLSPRPPWVPAWDDLARRGPAGRGALHGVLRRRSSSHADAQIGRVLAFVEELGETDNTIVVARVRQRRVGRGRRARLDQRRAGLERRPRRPPRAARPHRRDRHRDRAQQLPVGLDDGGQHAVPPLEARGARGRGRRPVHRPLAARHRRPRRDPAPVRPRDRRAAHDPRARRRRRRRTRSTASPQAPIDGTSFAYLLDDADAPERHTHAVLRDARQPRRSTTTAGRR